jgi:hypothetical protein
MIKNNFRIYYNPTTGEITNYTTMNFIEYDLPYLDLDQPINISEYSVDLETLTIQKIA